MNLDVLDIGISDGCLIGIKPPQIIICTYNPTYWNLCDDYSIRYYTSVYIMAEVLLDPLCKSKNTPALCIWPLGMLN